MNNPIAAENSAAPSIDQLVQCRQACLATMRTSVADAVVFKEAARTEAELAARIRRLRFAAAVLPIVLLTGCADMTPRERTAVGIAVGVVAVGAIAVYQDHHKSKPQGGAAANCVYQPASSICQVM